MRDAVALIVRFTIPAEDGKEIKLLHSAGLRTSEILKPGLRMSSKQKRRAARRKTLAGNSTFVAVPEPGSRVLRINRAMRTVLSKAGAKLEILVLS